MGRMCVDAAAVDRTSLDAANRLRTATVNRDGEQVRADMRTGIFRSFRFVYWFRLCPLLVERDRFVGSWASVRSVLVYVVVYR